MSGRAGWVRARFLSTLGVSNLNLSCDFRYTGWSSRYDEWIPRSSRRLAPLGELTDGENGAGVPDPITLSAAVAVDWKGLNRPTEYQGSGPRSTYSADSAELDSAGLNASDRGQQGAAAGFGPSSGDVSPSWTSEMQAMGLGPEVGMLLDVRDLVNKWCEAQVLRVDGPNSVFVHYVGWSSKWDERCSAPLYFELTFFLGKISHFPHARLNEF